MAWAYQTLFLSLFINWWTEADFYRSQQALAKGITCNAQQSACPYIYKLSISRHKAALKTSITHILRLVDLSLQILHTQKNYW